MKKIGYLCLFVLFTSIGKAQVSSFEELKAQLIDPTYGYNTIKHGADSLFAAWHTANPNDSGFAPVEKQFMRWEYFAANRHYVVGQASQSPQAFKTAQQNILTNFTPCTGTLPQSGWQNIGPNPTQTDKQAIGLIHAVEGYFSPHTSNNPDDLTLYASSGDVGGLFKSTNGGKTWTNISDQFGIPSLGVRTISVDWNNVDNVLAGTSGGEEYGEFRGYGILKYTATGASRIDICYETVGSSNTEEIGYVEVIKRDYDNPNYVYAAGRTKIWQSSDGGSTWTKVFENTTNTNAEFIDIEIQGGGVFASSVYVGDETHSEYAQIWVKRPGSAWVQANLPNLGNTCGTNTKAYPKLIVLDATPADLGYTYAFFVESKCNKTQYLYKTNDGGVSWTKVAEKTGSIFLPDLGPGSGVNNAWFGSGRYDFEISDLSPYTLYIGSNELWKAVYNPQTQTWSQVIITQYFPSSSQPMNSTHGDIRGICNLGSINALDRLLIANDGGVALTTSSPAAQVNNQWKNSQWLNLNGRDNIGSGLQIGEYYSLVAWKSSANMIAGSIHNDRSVFDGQEWMIGGGTNMGDEGFGDCNPEDPSYAIVCRFGRPVLRTMPGYTTSASLGGTSGGATLRDKVHVARANPNWVYWGSTQLFKANTSGTGAWQQTTPAFANWNPDKNSISAFKTAPSDINTIYLALDQPYWEAYDPNNPSLDKRKKLYKTTDGGQTWQNLTSNFSPNDANGNSYLQWQHITDFVIDPLNPDRVWAAMAGYHTDRRVYYSEDGGLSWNDLSTGLPPYPINALAYHEGTNDVIYAATDAGVYYFEVDETASPYSGQWHCFNNSLPPARITHIRLIPCENKIYASTWGRGLWVADLPVSQNSHVVTIKQDRTIPAATTLAFTGDLVVPNGVTLTINGTVKFAEGKSLIIEPGGKVLLDGGTLTADFACNGGTSWEGVQIRGNANLPQTFSNQGVFIAQNGATLSHARTALSNVGWGGSDFLWGTQGGIMECYNTTFANNKRDVQLISYHDFVGSYEKDYQAKFVSCTFLRDQNYAQQDLTASVSMWDVVGPRFYGCTFDMSDLTYAGNAQDLMGIYSLQSAFRTDRTGNGNTNTLFTGYNKAVYAENMCKADKFIVLQHTEFSDNLFGAHLLNTANARILFNTFKPSGVPTSNGVNISYGLYLDESTAYTFMENTFEGQGGTAAGAVAKNNGTGANRVYRNKFSKLEYGMQALDRNRSGDGSTGLEFTCNNFGQFGNAAHPALERNTWDITVRNTWGQPDGSHPLQEHGVKRDQGFFKTNAPAGYVNKPEDLANNRFSTINALQYNFANQLNMGQPNEINYFFDPNGLPGNMEPNPINDLNVTEKPHDLDVDYDLHCLAEVTENGDPGSGVTGLHVALVQEEAALSGKRSLYSQLLNGGNTAEIEADILLAGLPEYQQLYIDLLYMSPHVDIPLIVDLIWKQDFPELPLRNIILANPHAARDPEVWEALQNRTPAISQQTLADIEAGRQTITTHDLLLGEMGYHATAAHYHALDLLYHYATDSTYFDTDSLHNLLQNRTALPFVLMRAEHYLNRGNYSELNGMWQNVDESWYSEGDMMALPHWQSYYSTLATAFGNGESYVALSTGTLISLQNIQATAPGAVWHAINNLLKPFGMGDESYIEPVVTTVPSNKRATDFNRPVTRTTDFQIFPNPAKDYIEVRWDWFELGLDSSFNLEVMSMNGQLVFRKKISNWKNNIAIIDLSNLPSGLFILRAAHSNGALIGNWELSIVRD